MIQCGVARIIGFLNWTVFGPTMATGDKWTWWGGNKGPSPQQTRSEIVWSNPKVSGGIFTVTPENC